MLDSKRGVKIIKKAPLNRLNKNPKGKTALKMDSLIELFSNYLTPVGSSGSTQSVWQVLWQTLGAMGIAYLGGVFSSLTPCVYPMIPITVGVMGGLHPTRNWREVSVKGISYVAGMTVIYSFLGVIAGLSGKVFGSFTHHSGWYITLGIVLNFAALVMLDVIPFNPALWWEEMKLKFSSRNKPKPIHSDPHLKKELTWFGAFFLGASSGFIAAPCTTPVLTGILAYIAKTQSVGLGFLLMASFSLGLGTLLIVVAFFTGAIQILPRSGYWMKLVKTGSGLILLAFAEYLIYRAGSFGGL